MKPYNINTNKALFFVFASIFLTIFVAYFYYVPMAKNLKISKIKHKQSKSLYLDTKLAYDSLSKELKDLIAYNKNTTSKLNKSFNIHKTKQEFNAFMNATEIKTSSQKPYKVYFLYQDLNISGEFVDPKNIYFVISDLNNMQNIFSLNFPIEIHAQKNKVKTSFGTRLYNIADLNQTLQIGKQ